MAHIGKVLYVKAQEPEFNLQYEYKSGGDRQAAHTCNPRTEETRQEDPERTGLSAGLAASVSSRLGEQSCLRNKVKTKTPTHTCTHIYLHVHIHTLHKVICTYIHFLKNVKNLGCHMFKCLLEVGEVRF